MKTHFFKLFVITLMISSTSCKKETQFTDFKYADKPETIACGDMDAKLLKEALYSFEDDIVNHYDSINKNLSRSYSRLINDASSRRLKFQDVVSPHSLKVFEALKNNQNLWNQGNATSNLNYNSKVIKCIANNISDQRLKSIFNSLLSTNSLTPFLFGEPIKSNSGQLLRDKYLATYVALEFYYAKLFDVDLTNVTLEKPKPKVDFNKKPVEPQTVPQTGDNK